MHIVNWLYKKYPQNIILKKPLLGTFILFICCFGFIIIYRPLDLHASGSFNFWSTMAIYSIVNSIPVLFISMFLRNSRNLSNPLEWNLLKELFFIILILFAMGISTYLMGFIMESPNHRWNLGTFFSSVKYAFLIGIFPLLFFTVINYQNLFVTDIVRDFDKEKKPTSNEPAEEMIHIESQLIKEELCFYPSQFLYAEASGNYVVFYLAFDNQIRKKMIRNSINNIELQLSSIPHFMRTHRAFIINLRQVASQKGNTLGYQLKLNGVDNSIPVSRQNTRNFDKLIKKYQ